MTRQAARNLNEAANLAPTKAEKDTKQLRAAALFESIGDYRLTIARILDAGIAFAMQGDYTAANVKFQEGYELARLRDAKSSMVASLSNLGQSYTYQNDYAKALDNLIRATEVVHPSVGTNIQGDILLNIGSLYHGIGEYELALAKFREARPVFEKIDDRTGVAYAISNSGEVYVEMGDYEKALESFLEAQRIRANLKPTDPTSYEFMAADPSSLYNIASVYRLQGRSREAREQILRALELCDKIADSECKTRALVEMSRLDLASGNPTSGLKNANLAAELAKSRYYPARLADAMTLAAQAHIRLSHRKEAEAALMESISIIESVANTLIGGETTGAAFFNKVSSSYELLTELLVKSERYVEALTVAERMKARALLSTLGDGSRGTVKAMSRAERAAERSLRSDLVDIAAELSRERDLAKQVVLRERLAKKRIEFEDFRFRLYARHPDLQVQRGEMKTISLSEARSLLPDRKSAIVEFIVAENQTFLFLIAGDSRRAVSLKVFTINVTATDLAARIEKFRSEIGAGGLDFSRASRELFDLLLKPAEAYLSGTTKHCHCA